MNVDNTDVFSCCYEFKHFSQSPMFNQWAGVQEMGGSIARQITKLANGNTPYHERHAQFMNGGWLRARNLVFSVPWVWIFSCSGIWTFLGIQSFSGVMQNLWVWWNLKKHELRETYRFHDRFLGTGCKSVIGQWDNCIVYSLFCIFNIISIIGIISSISISFVVLLNSLCLSP